MATKKRTKKVQHTYTVNAVKPLSNARRYEFLWSRGVQVSTGVDGQTELLKGKALDGYIDRRAWEESHPGQNPVKTWKV